MRKMVCFVMAFFAIPVYLYAGDLIVSGKIGVGTTSPTSTLSVGGAGMGPMTAIYGYNTSGNSIQHYSGVYGDGDIGVTGRTSSYIGVFGYATPGGIAIRGDTDQGTGVMGLNYGQGIGVSGTCYSGIGVRGSGTTYDFYAYGSGIDYGSASSIRWKKNVKEIDHALGLISDIRGVYFDWDAEHGGKHAIGFIGEEVGKYIPEVVVWDETDKNYITGMDYSKMTPVLLEAIKEQQKQIEALKAEVQALKKALSR